MNAETTPAREADIINPLPEPWDAIDALAVLGNHLDTLIAAVDPRSNDGWAVTAAREAVLNLADALDVADEADLWQTPNIADHGIDPVRTAIMTAMRVTHSRNGNPDIAALGEEIGWAGTDAVDNLIALSGAGTEPIDGIRAAVMALRAYAVEMSLIIRSLDLDEDTGDLFDLAVAIGSARETFLGDAEAMQAVAASAPDRLGDSADIVVGHLRDVAGPLTRLITSDAVSHDTGRLAESAFNRLPGLRLVMVAAGGEVTPDEEGRQ